MADLFRNKYRIDSARLKGYDYRRKGLYFITICTDEMICYFGEICNKKMILNETGKIAHNYWQEIPQHFPNCQVDVFIIMPNHVHGILMLNNNTNRGSGAVETLHATSQNGQQKQNENQKDKNEIMSNISPKPGSISTIIRSYKSAVTKNARSIQSDFSWQTRFHDHLIRDDKEYQKIANYIVENPLNWQKDKFNKA
jgi:REP element-mobilizing transposase RayT